MNFAEIEAVLSVSKQNPKTLCRIYMFACAMNLRSEQMEMLKKEICLRLAMNEQQFSRSLQQTYDDWSQRIEKAEAVLMHSSFISEFPARHSKLFLRSSISRQQAQILLVHMLSLALQRVSLLTFHNHLHHKDVRILVDMLETPKLLGSVSKVLEEPVLQVMKGSCSPISAEYIQRMLAAAQITGYAFLYFLLDGNGSRLHVCRENLMWLRKAPLDDIRRFLASNDE